MPLPVSLRTPIAHLIVIATVVGATGSGCRGFRRIAECKQFVETANAAVLELQSLDQANDPNPSADAYLNLGQRFEAFHDQLAQLPITDPELKQAVVGYQTTIKNAAKQCGKYEKELRSRDKVTGSSTSDKRQRKRHERTLSRIRTDMKKALRSHKSSLSRFKALCQPRK